MTPKMHRARWDLARMKGVAGWIVGRAGTSDVTTNDRAAHADGVQFELPVPLMYRHELAIGRVTRAMLVGDALDIEAEIASPDETRDPALAKRLRHVWSQIRAGKLTGLSWSTRAIDRIDRESWSSTLVEVSVTDSPANPRACITDVLVRAA